MTVQELFKNIFSKSVITMDTYGVLVVIEG